MHVLFAAPYEQHACAVLCAVCLTQSNGMVNTPLNCNASVHPWGLTLSAATSAACTCDVLLVITLQLASQCICSFVMTPAACRGVAVCLRLTRAQESACSPV